MAHHERDEHTPLLASDSHIKEVDDVVALNPHAHHPRSLKAVGSECRILLVYALPMIFTNLLIFSEWAIVTFAVGHLGTNQLAAAAIGSLTFNVFGMVFVVGFVLALDTLCTQAVTREPEMTAIYAGRTQVLLLIMWIPQLILFWSAKPLLLMMGQPEQVADLAAQFLKVIAFGLPGYGVSAIFRRWIQAHGNMSVPTLIHCIAAPINLFLNWLLVWGPEPFHLGFIGAPVAVALTLNLLGVLSVAYTVIKRPAHCEKFLSRRIFTNLGENFKLGMAGSLTLASEAYGWELVALASSWIGPETMAAQSIVTTSSIASFQLLLATGGATSVRVGNLLGANQPSLARSATKASMILTVLQGTLTLILLTVFRRSWAKIFTNDEAVISIVSVVLPLTASSLLPDGIAGVAASVLRAASKATVSAWINVLSYWLIGIPLAFWLCFGSLHLGLQGLWTGLLVALTVAAIVFLIYLTRLDFEGEAIKASQKRERVSESGIQTSHA